MKKTLALLMLAAMLISTGCGGNTADGVKKDAQEAQQKVEQKVDDAKKDAANVANDAAQKVDEAKKDAEAKADQVKADAEKTVDQAKKDAATVANDAAQKVEQVAENIKGRIIALEGVKPGMTLDEVKAIFGEPTSTGGDNVTFGNGLTVETNDAGKVEDVRVTQAGIRTPEGVEVGMADSALNEYCGPADKVDVEGDGEVDYKYFGVDGMSQVTYTTRNGIITEIKCSLK